MERMKVRSIKSIQNRNTTCDTLTRRKGGGLVNFEIWCIINQRSKRPFIIETQQTSALYSRNTCCAFKSLLTHPRSPPPTSCTMHPLAPASPDRARIRRRRPPYNLIKRHSAKTVSIYCLKFSGREMERRFDPATSSFFLVGQLERCDIIISRMGLTAGEKIRSGKESYG